MAHIDERLDALDTCQVRATVPDHEPALGIGVRDFACQARVHGQDVVRPVTGRADGILSKAQRGDERGREAQLRRLKHSGAAGDVRTPHAMSPGLCVPGPCVSEGKIGSKCVCGAHLCGDLCPVGECPESGRAASHVTLHPAAAVALEVQPACVVCTHDHQTRRDALQKVSTAALLRGVPIIARLMRSVGIHEKIP